jgi:hypothetical protein
MKKLLVDLYNFLFVRIYIPNENLKKFQDLEYKSIRIKEEN